LVEPVDGPFLLLMDGSEIDGNVYPFGRVFREAVQGLYPCVGVSQHRSYWGVRDIIEAFALMLLDINMNATDLFHRVAARKFVREALKDNCLGVWNVKERREPVWCLLEACNTQGIPTVHYPHGFIGEGILPFRSKHVWYWNEVMYQRFHPDSGAEGQVAGYWFPEKISLKERRTDKKKVLLISQFHAYRLGITDNPLALKEIFSMCGDLVRRDNSLELQIKFHPYDTEEDKLEAWRLLGEVSMQRVTVETSGIQEALSKCDVVLTVSSTAIIDAASMGKPTVLFGKSELVMNNLGSSYRGADELEGVLEVLKTTEGSVLPNHPVSVLDARKLIIEFLTKQHPGRL